MPVGKQLKNIDKKILKAVKKSKRPLSKTQIAQKIKISPATVSKYVDVLSAKNILNVEVYGNIHLVTMGDLDAT